MAERRIQPLQAGFRKNMARSRDVFWALEGANNNRSPGTAYLSVYKRDLGSLLINTQRMCSTKRRGNPRSRPREWSPVCRIKMQVLRKKNQKKNTKKVEYLTYNHKAPARVVFLVQHDKEIRNW